MKKMKLIFTLLMATFTLAFCQPDKTFTVPVRLNGGLYIGTDPVLHLTWPTGTGSMVYPLAGIPISTGTAWGASIVNNSVQWNANTTWINTNGANAVTAFSWGNHAGLYKPITWKPDYETEVLNKPEEVELAVALPQLNGIAFPVKTQTEINALTPVKGLVLINSTDNVMQWYDGAIWKKFPTTN